MGSAISIIMFSSHDECMFGQDVSQPGTANLILNKNRFTVQEGATSV